jgi:hypothetical protein
MASPIPENLIILNINTSYGALLVGTGLACMVYGATCLQL